MARAFEISGPARSRASSSPATAMPCLRPDRDRRGQPSGAGPGRRSGGAPHPGAGPGAGPGRPGGVPGFGRRLGAAGVGRAGPDPSRQAGGDAGAAQAARRSARSTRCASTCRRSRAAVSPPPRPAQVLTLAISDVPGDDPAVIASGPTVPDPTSFADARAVVAKYGIEEPAAVLTHLDTAAEETPKPGDRGRRARYELIASPQQALAAAAARRAGARHRAGRAERSDRGRVARRRGGARGDRAAGSGRPVPGRRDGRLAAGGAAVGRRDDGDRAGRRARRPQRRVPAGAGGASRRRRRRDGLRYRRHRRNRRQCRGDCLPEHDARARARAGHAARRWRRTTVTGFSPPRGIRRHRPDPDQCQ